MSDASEIGRACHSQAINIAYICLYMLCLYRVGEKQVRLIFKCIKLSP